MDNILPSILNIIDYLEMNDYVDLEVLEYANLRVIIKPKEEIDITIWRRLGSVITSFLYNRKEKFMSFTSDNKIAFEVEIK